MIAQSYEEAFYLSLFIYLFIHLFIDLFIYSFIYRFIYLFIYLFSYLLTYLLTVRFIERCHLLGGNLKKTVTFGANYFVAIQAVSVIWDVHYWEISLYYLGSNVNF